MFALNDNIEFLTAKAREVRRLIIKMLAEAGSGHPGGALSATDLIVALYFARLRHNPKDPEWPERDRFFMSKGHACPLWYAVLAECGYFPKEELRTLRKFGSILQGHPCKKRTPGVEMSSGSLGQGLSVASGAALAGKIDKKDYRVYVLLGDGEIEEGQVWEAAMAAGFYKLDNLTAILDYNGMQIDGHLYEVMSAEPIPEKFRAFRWEVKEIEGHDFRQVLDAYDWAEKVVEKPALILAHTIKGKGVSFMERVVDWHGKAPTKEQAQQALKELA